MKKRVVQPLNPKYRQQGKMYGQVDMTDDEVAARQAEETANLATKPMRQWEAHMKSSDNDLPRWAEDIIDKVGTDGLAQETVDKYNAKKIKRAERPT